MSKRIWDKGIERNPVIEGSWMNYPRGVSAAGWRSPVASYRSLWSFINGPDSWELNPWVWVVEFKRVAKEEEAGK